MEVSWFHSCGRQTEKQHHLILAHFEHEIANAGILICHIHSVKFPKFLVSKSGLHYLVMRIKIHYFNDSNTFFENWNFTSGVALG